MDAVCQKLVDDIYRAAQETDFDIKTFKPRGARRHLGVSGIYNSCDLCLWRTFRGLVQEPPEGRMQTLFDLGEVIEAQTIHYIKAAGYQVRGEQKKYSLFNGLISGSCDLIIGGFTNSEYMADVKSINDKGYKTVVKDGTRKARHKYYAQISTYAYLEGLEWCMVIYVNKNTSDIHVERWFLDKEYVAKLLDKVYGIITSDTPPQCNGDYYAKRYCPYNYLSDIEQYRKLNPQICKTCSYASIHLTEQRWCCRKHGYFIRDPYGKCKECVDILHGKDVYDKVPFEKIKEYNK